MRYFVIPESEEESKRLVYGILLLGMALSLAWWLKDLGVW